MAFEPKRIEPIDLNPSKAVGVNLPFNGNAVFIQNYQTKDAIKNNLINFFLTDTSERYLNPNFGAGLRSFIFEQLTEGNIDFLQEDINEKLFLYFPNIRIDDLEITGDLEDNRINIKMRYTIINTNLTDELQFTFN